MVKLFVEYISNDDAMAYKIVAEGENLKEALLDLMDRTYLCVSREIIKEDEEYDEIELSAEEVLERVKMWDDGCDYIVFVKDDKGRVYINNYQLEEW